MRSKIVVNKPKQTKEIKRNIPISVIILIEAFIVVCLLFLISAFPSSTNASIELGNLNARSKTGTWVVNNHKINKSQLKIDQRHKKEHIYFNHKEYKLVPKITNKQLSTKYMRKLYKQDRVFKIQRTYDKIKRHERKVSIQREHIDKILVQIKAPKSLNRIPIYTHERK